MSTTDTMTPLVSAPWFDADGNPLPVRALPGLRPEVVRGLECSYPGIIHPTLRAARARGAIRPTLSLWTTAGLCGRRVTLGRLAPRVQYGDSSQGAATHSLRQ
jgi:hypothetical protein